CSDQMGRRCREYRRLFPERPILLIQVNQHIVRRAGWVIAQHGDVRISIAVEIARCYGYNRAAEVIVESEFDPGESKPAACEAESAQVVRRVVNLHRVGRVEDEVLKPILVEV